MNNKPESAMETSVNEFDLMRFCNTWTPSTHQMQNTADTCYMRQIRIAACASYSQWASQQHMACNGDWQLGRHRRLSQPGEELRHRLFVSECLVQPILTLTQFLEYFVRTRRPVAKNRHSVQSCTDSAAPLGTRLTPTATKMEMVNLANHFLRIDFVSLNSTGSPQKPGVHKLISPFYLILLSSGIVNEVISKTPVRHVERSQASIAVLVVCANVSVRGSIQPF